MSDNKINGRGRPKFDDPKDKRDKRLPVVQVSEGELTTYKKAAEHESKTFSAWVRDVLGRAST